MRNWFCASAFSAVTQTPSKNDNVCIRLFNIYNGNVPRDSFSSPESNPGELAAPQKHMGRWYMSFNFESLKKRTVRIQKEKDLCDA